MLTGDGFLDEFQQTVQAQLVRLRHAVQGISEAELNHREGDAWSIGQILDHLLLSHAPYLKRMEAAAENAPKGPCEAKMTFLGGQIFRGAGPDFNAPVGPGLHPKKDKYDLGVIVQYAKLTESTIEFAKRCEGIDLTRAKFRNPIVPLFSMNLVDGFAIMNTHGERHLRQIEARRQK